jgi:hypothetical protein
MEPSVRPAPEANAAPRAGSRDGVGAGDHDQVFRFGSRPTSAWTYPFTGIQYARLLVLRGRIQNGEFSEDNSKLSAKRSAQNA